jgi:hypothetical protein
VKEREGAREGKERTFGPQQPKGTVWLLTRRAASGGAESREAVGPTAIKAAQSIGWALGELILDPEIVPRAATRG